MTDIFVILDENNKLWHAPKNVAHGTIESFGLVQFNYNSENQITFINGIRLGRTGYIKSLRDLEESTYYSIPSNEIGDVNFDYYRIINWNFDSIYIVGYLRSDYDISIGFGDRINQYDFSNSIWNRNYIFSSQDSNIIKKRYFLTDNINKTYRELSGKFIEVINHLITNTINHDFTLPYDWEKHFQGTTCSLSEFAYQIKSICELILKFNPYDIFESFRIYRVSTSKSYYDFFGEHITESGFYDSSSISYRDEYLDKWFPMPLGEEKEGFDAYGAYHSSLRNESIRFDERENEIKAKAYSEYCLQEHFDSLIMGYYHCLKKRVEKIESGEIKYTPFPLFPEHFKIREVYKWFNIRLKKIPRSFNRFTYNTICFHSPREYDESQLKMYEKELIDAIYYFNNKINN